MKSSTKNEKPRHLVFGVGEPFLLSPFGGFRYISDEDDGSSHSNADYDEHGIPEGMPPTGLIGDPPPDRTPGEMAVDLTMQDECLREWWQMTSGLQTVEKWVSNYRKHPAGWAALLMIHGIPEVTGRLRAKVESYAMYSALFLSAAIPALIEAPESVILCAEHRHARLYQDEHEMICHIRKRMFFYCLGFGVASHMLCIMLAMGFVNALNETARDSDVFRMFARGKGFLATVKCQNAFRAGAGLDFLGILAAVHS